MMWTDWEAEKNRDDDQAEAVASPCSRVLMKNSESENSPSDDRDDAGVKSPAYMSIAVEVYPY